jgi:hypothetical protein
MYYTVW